MVQAVGVTVEDTVSKEGENTMEVEEAELFVA